MRRHRAAVEYAQAFERLDSRHVARRERILVLLPRLRHVNQQRRVVPVGQRAPERLVRIRIKRVRPHSRHNQRIAHETRQCFSVKASASPGVFASATGNPMMVSPKTPRIPASFDASATTSSK
jgi:hypothetical protein